MRHLFTRSTLLLVAALAAAIYLVVATSAGG